MGFALHSRLVTKKSKQFVFTFSLTAEVSSAAFSCLPFDDREGRLAN